MRCRAGSHRARRAVDGADPAEEVIGLGEGRDAFVAGHLRGSAISAGPARPGPHRPPPPPGPAHHQRHQLLLQPAGTTRYGPHRQPRAAQGRAGQPNPLRPPARPHLFPTEPRAAVAPASAPLRAAALGTAAGSAFCEAMAVPGRFLGLPLGGLLGWTRLGPLPARLAPIPGPSPASSAFRSAPLPHSV